MKMTPRSARVAPLISHQGDSTNPFGKLKDQATTLKNARNFINECQSSEDSPKMDDELDGEKSEAKKKWSLLVGSIRTTMNVQKAFQKINSSLLNEKHIDIKIKSDGQEYCLLQLPGREDLPNLSSKVKRKESLLTRTVGCELINYFIELSNMEDESRKIVDYSRLQEMFENGVDANKLDNYGQSVLHEVARVWHKDVAKFLLENGIYINQADSYGRTPLHVASAANYSEMVEFLLHSGADINSQTTGENQTPMHYAAKNDAIDALKVLLDNGANLNDVDYKGRSPLQLAAELDRSMSAQFLLDQGAPACVYDESRMGALVLMIQKMPNVALDALEQFHEKNRASRTQYFYLNFLIPPHESKRCFAKSPLEAAIESGNHNLLLHPVFQQLIKLKWKRLARLGAWLYGFTNICISILWTARLCNMPPDPKDLFKGTKGVIGVLMDIIAVIVLLLLIVSEIRQYLRAKKYSISYKEWREEQLEKDLKYAHPQWPEERIYIEREIRELRESGSSYAADKWNYFDWITYVMMTSTIIAQGCNIYYRTKGSNNAMRGIGSVTLIFLWLRLLRYALPFQSLGLFVVMLSHVAEDTLKLVFLLLHFCIPYMAAFWINFGMDGVEGYTLTYLELLYNQFQMIVVGDYNFDQIVVHSQIMSRLLCGSFIFFAGIICLNLFIALMSDTFQRVYDNAKATAVMERAKFITDVEITIPSSKLRRHREWIAKCCNPLVLYYDDDTVDSETSTIKRMTHQIGQDVEEIKTLLENRPSDESGQPGSDENLNAFLKDEISDLKMILQNFQVEYFKSLVQTRAEITGLGLMLKELIERKECKTCSQRKRRNREREATSNVAKNVMHPNDNTLVDSKNFQQSHKQNEIGKATRSSAFADTTINNGFVSTEAVINTSTDSSVKERNRSPIKNVSAEVLPPLAENRRMNVDEDNQLIQSTNDGNALCTMNAVSAMQYSEALNTVPPYNRREAEVQHTDENSRESCFKVFPSLEENEGQ